MLCSVTYHTSNVIIELSKWDVHSFTVYTAPNSGLQLYFGHIMCTCGLVLKCCYMKLAVLYCKGEEKYLWQTVHRLCYIVIFTSL